MAEHNDTGKWGEDVAANLLRQKGYNILARNYRVGSLEIDIIAEDKNFTVFVEVKTRSSKYADILPEQYVDREKEMNIVHAASTYIKTNRITKDIRFDVVSLIINPLTQEISRLEHIENAFYPTLRTVSQNSFNGQYRWQMKGKRRGL
ncbi:MAG: YraN family protein [Paludibacteraceae bacterium]|nr:YraN family protein [Paludibacteraceae bacterium]